MRVILFATVAAVAALTASEAQPVRLRMVIGGGELIPAAKLTNWEAGVYTGVPGGIPTTRTQCVTSACQDVTNAAAGYKDGTLDAVGLINAAITSAPVDTYVLIPAGTWRIDNQIAIAGTDDSMTLRGAGQSQTIIDCRATRCLTAGTAIGGSWNTPASGNDITSFTPDVSTGGTVLNGLGSTTGFLVGNLVRVSVAQDTTVPVFSTAGWGYENDAPLRGQLSLVTAKTATTLTVFPPLSGSSAWSGLAAIVHVSAGQLESFGLEDLTFDSDNASVQTGVVFFHTVGSWLKDVTIDGTSDTHLFLDTSLQCEMRRSTLVHLGAVGETGMFFYAVTNCLIEDNIIDDTSPSWVSEGQTTGNVIAYNIIDFATGVGNGIGIDTNHGPSPAFNLFEGNVAPNITSDGYYGGETELIMFRNLFHGMDLDPGDTPSYCLALKRFTRNSVVVGNLLGASTDTLTCSDNYGLPNIGNGSFTGTAQPSQGDYWADWNPTDGVTPLGSLTSRTSASIGQITLTRGVLNNGPYPYLRSVVDFTAYANVNVTRVGSTDVYDVVVVAGTLPALSTSLIVWPGAGGFQEKDLDVEATTTKKLNNYGNTGIPVGEQTTTAFPASLFRSSKPSWFNSLTWPPVNPSSPVYSKEIIPAGYRLVNGGANPP